MIMKREQLIGEIGRLKKGSLIVECTMEEKMFLISLRNVKLLVLVVFFILITVNGGVKSFAQGNVDKGINKCFEQKLSIILYK
jgi:hypothetical protein